MKLDTIESAVEELKEGKLVIVYDDVTENEADLIGLSDRITVEQVLFIIKNGRGLPCVSITEKRAAELCFEPMVAENREAFGARITQSFDHITCGSGVSAFDRLKTIKAIAHEKTRPTDFRKPGHTFCVVANEGGLKARSGHTEAGIELAKLCGAFPSALLCEIVSDEGTMLAGEELQEYAKKNNLKLISMRQLANYVASKKVTTAIIPTPFGGFTLKSFTLPGKPTTIALVKGEVSGKEHVLTRIHSSCLTGDALLSLRCDCRQQLTDAMRIISEAGTGIIIYEDQEGRGIGLSNKIKAYELQDNGMDTIEANHALGLDADKRNYLQAAQTLNLLDVKSVCLLTNNPSKINALKKLGIEVSSTFPLLPSVNSFNARYLETKRTRMDHDIEASLDEHFMNRALELAKQGIGRTKTNPLVGCVIVKDGIIISEGYHHVFGGDHAEVDALKKINYKAEGATMYVSLEPCCHYAKTPPCTDAIIKSGISKLVIAMQDPNPLVAGKGVSIMREAGIEIEQDVLKQKAVEQNEAFIKFISTGKPFVVLKMASTLNGKIAYPNIGAMISNDEANEFVQELRNKYDAILVGINTVLKDDPLLTCRITGGRDPLRVVLDSTLRIPLDAKVLKDENIVIATTHKHDKEKMKLLKEKNVKIIETNGELVNLNELLTELGKMNVCSVLVEGGAKVARSFTEQKLVDKAIFIMAPKMFSEGITNIEGVEMDMQNAQVTVAGNNAIIQGTIA